MAAIPDGPAKDAGKAVGTAAAAGMLAMRTGDHFDDNVPYVQPPTGPGRVRADRADAAGRPGLALVRPFTFDSPSDYRPSGRRVELTSKRYAKDVAELQTFGRVDSTVGTRSRRRRSSSTPSRRTSSSTARCVSWRSLAASTCASRRGCSATSMSRRRTR